MTSGVARIKAWRAGVIGEGPVDSNDHPTRHRRSPSPAWIAAALITIVAISVLALLFLGGQVEARFGPVGSSV